MGTLGKVLSSRTVWGAAILGIMGILPTIAPMIPQGTKAGALITIALAGWTIYCRIRAKQPLGPVIDKTIAQTVDAVHELGISAEGAPTSVVGQVEQTAAVAAVVKAKP
jgi:hypothetical protein